jgi:predicted Zn-dependent protease
MRLAREASTLKRAGRLVAAESVLQDAVAAAPNWAELRSNLGNLLMERGLAGNAWPQHRAAVVLGVDQGGLLVNLSMARRGDEPNQARTWLARAMALMPDDLDVVGSVASWLIEDERPYGAERLLSRLLLATPLRGDLHRLRLIALAKQERPIDAAAALRTMLVLVPDDGAALSDAVLVLSDRLPPLEADALIVRARRMDPANASLLRAHARILDRLGQVARASEMRAEAGRRDPGRASALRAESDQWLGIGQIARAVELVSEASGLSPADMECLAQAKRLARVSTGFDAFVGGLAMPAVSKGAHRLSVVLPTLRPALLASLLPWLARAAGEYEHEVVVVSPRPVEGPNVRWIEEKVRRGGPSAQSEAYAHATGDVIILGTDDTMPVPRAYALAAERAIAGAAGGVPFATGLRWMVNNAYDIAGTVYGYYYPYLPVMTRRSVERAGGWIGGGYAANWADADLALRVWQAGGRCALCRSALVRSHPFDPMLEQATGKASPTLHADFRRFDERWRPVFGAGWGRDPVDINRDHPVAEMIDDTFIGYRARA